MLRGSSGSVAKAILDEEAARALDRRTDFWDEEKEAVFKMARFKLLDAFNDQEIKKVDGFVRKTLPMLAKHLDGTALHGLKQESMACRVRAEFTT